MKIWANSGDSHFPEPEDLWRSALPPALAERMPRSVKDADGEWETLHVDGQEFRRRLPKPELRAFNKASYPPGARHVPTRLKDLDGEGVWGEVVYPSLGMWNAAFKDPALLKEAMRVSNDWVYDTILRASPRFVPTAQVSMLCVDDALAEMQRAAGLGFRAVFLPTSTPPAQEDYTHEIWEPFWSAAEEAGMVVAYHIGTDPPDHPKKIGVTYRGAGAAVLNYAETTFSGQRAAMKMVASGILDRHPKLRVLVSEGGASWVPFLGDRMNEGYRQHASMVRPKLKRPPKETLYEQVYTSFQHDESAVAALTGMGYNNVMWGSDYPHLEGTFGHTQETLHGLFDGVDDAVRHRITIGSFLDLFPEVGEPPALSDVAR